MTTAEAIDLDKAKLDPASVFASPSEVLSAPNLSLEDKRTILSRWEEDAGDLMRATEEGMPPSGQPAPGDVLRAVQDAIKRLGA
jgi:hypothetical protein